MNELIDTTEMYLRTIYELMEEGITPLRARIAERLHQSGPTVSQTVARMERDGLLTVHGDRRIELSATGQELAVAVMRKHRLAERLLVDVIGLDWSRVHDEACRWEHVISDDVELRLVQILSNPQESPYGNPIPGLEALGGATTGGTFREGVEPLPQVLAGEPVRVVLRRMSENSQADDQTLQVLAEAGIVPGCELEATGQGGVVVLRADGASCDIPLGVAEGLFVSRA
ncbi:MULTISPECIES: metal-dependent transcriptional regulator [unclassified Luteococcus]|uniref:metal-dependent transcriptional regulator n=1 Tax=unclassified Luteococcus TaxID=2639923 RepID=UPI00313F049D